MDPQTPREIEAHTQEAYVVALGEMAEENAKEWLRTQQATSAHHGRKAAAKHQRIRFSEEIGRDVRPPRPSENPTQPASDQLRGVLGTKYANWLATNWGYWNR